MSGTKRCKPRAENHGIPLVVILSETQCSEESPTRFPT